MKRCHLKRSLTLFVVSALCSFIFMSTMQVQKSEPDPSILSIPLKQDIICMDTDKPSYSLQALQLRTANVSFRTCMPTPCERNYRCSQPSAITIEPENGCIFNESSSYLFGRYSKHSDYQYFVSVMPKMLIIIPSVAEQFLKRKIVRSHWGKNLPNNYQIVFALGITKTSLEQQKVAREAAKFGDILQFEMVDNYRNFTRKVFDMLKWTADNCDSNTFVMKADSDAMLLLPGLQNLMRSAQIHQKVGIYSKCGRRMNLKPVRDIEDKWYTGPELWNCPEFPRFCTGNAYLMSPGVPQKLVQTTIQYMIPVSWHLEDVIYTGVVADLAGARRYHMDGFFTSWDRVCSRKSVIVNLEGPSEGEMITAWQKYQDTCGSYSPVTS